MFLESLIIRICTTITFLFFIVIGCSAQFEPEIPLSYSLTSSGSKFIVLTDDLDLDGDQDIISSGSHQDNIVWSENLGNDIFLTPKIITGTLDHIYPQAISIVDLNGDGKKDVLASIIAGDKIVWYENEGSGNFTSEQTITNQVFDTRSITGADIDNDGDQDVISASYGDDKIAWYENDGFGNFSDQQIIASLNGPLNVKVADLDNNGFLDIVVSSYFDQNIVWYSNQGGSNFLTQQTLASSIISNSFCLADKDGDNDLDLFSVYSQGVFFVKNLGSGVFGLPQTISNTLLGAPMIQDQDIDNDGDVDLTVSSLSPYKVVWLENVNGLFTEHVVTTGIISPGSVWSADLDNDGDCEILAASQNNGQAFWYKNLNGNFTVNEITASTDGPKVVLAVNINNDAFTDIVSASGYDNKIVWYKNLGSDNYIAQQTISNILLNVNSLDAFDVDGDSWNDVIAATQSGDSICWYKNLNGVSFGSAQLISNLTDDPKSLFSCDLDQDGDKDLLSASLNDDKIAWYENLGGSFGPQQIVSTLANYPYSVYASDLNGDSLLDILSASSIDNKIAWYPNVNGTFGPQQIISLQAAQAKVVRACDIDNDGDNDVVSASSNDNKVAWYENQGNGIFGVQQIISNQTTAVNVLICEDMDADGMTDIIAGYLNSVVWFKNLGNSQFSSEQLISSIANAVKSIVIEDLDRDGDRDVLYAAYNRDVVGLVNNAIYDPFQVRGLIYIDQNQNGIQDGLEQGVNQISILSSPNYSYAFTYPNGNYLINFNQHVSPVLYQIQPDLSNNWGISSDSTSYSVLVDNSFIYKDSLDFGLFPTFIENNIETDMVSGFPSCNDTINLWLNYHNIGTTIPSGVIHLELNDTIEFINANIQPDSIIGNNYYWSFDSLYYFTDENIKVSIKMPDFNSMGDTLLSFLTVIAQSNGVQNGVYHDTLSQLIVCAYDPNDKIAFPLGLSDMGYISPETPWIDYTIRFQNTGTDVANYIVIEDQLDTNLVWSSLVPLASSHSYEISYHPTGKVIFSFPNINLPDSNVNFLGSQGFIKYRVNLAQNLPAGTPIRNKAFIYFENNPAVITNTSINTIVDCPLIEPTNYFADIICEGDTFSISSSDITFDYELDFFGVTILFNGQLEEIPDTIGVFNLNLSYDNSLCHFDTIVNLTIHPLPEIEINPQIPLSICVDSGVIVLPDSNPLFGIYSGSGVNNGMFDPNFSGTGFQNIYYTFSSSEGCSATDSLSIFVDSCFNLNLSNLNTAAIKVYPNPFYESMSIDFGTQLTGDYDLIMTDISGRLLMNIYNIVGSQIRISREDISNGVVILQLINHNYQPIWNARVVVE